MFPYCCSQVGGTRQGIKLNADVISDKQSEANDKGIAIMFCDTAGAGLIFIVPWYNEVRAELHAWLEKYLKTASESARLRCGIKTKINLIVAKLLLTLVIAAYKLKGGARSPLSNIWIVATT